jgi:cell fate (sporulation/competence/biofilm development) regulator YmcA (YheA/YmcA/DUF963 family)
MKRQIIAFLVMSVLLSSIPAVLAQSDFDEAFERGVKGIFIFIFGDDFPEHWMTFGGFMQFIILPFVALLAVMYGILSELNIFRNSQSTRIVLAVTFAAGGGYFALSSMKGWMILNSTLAVWGFGLVLGVGIVFWAWGDLLHGWRKLEPLRQGKDVVKAMKTIEDKEKKRSQLIDELSELRTNWTQLQAYGKYKAAQDVRREMDAVRAKIDSLDKEIKDKKKDMAW